MKKHIFSLFYFISSTSFFLKSLLKFSMLFVLLQHCHLLSQQTLDRKQELPAVILYGDVIVFSVDTIFNSKIRERRIFIDSVSIVKARGDFSLQRAVNDTSLDHSNQSFVAQVKTLQKKRYGKILTATKELIQRNRDNENFNYQINNLSSHFFLKVNHRRNNYFISVPNIFKFSKAEFCEYYFCVNNNLSNLHFQRYISYDRKLLKDYISKAFSIRPPPSIAI